METMKRLFGALASTRIFKGGMTALLLLLLATPAFAGGEAELKIPALQGSFLGMSGHNLLLIGLVICCSALASGSSSTPRSGISRSTSPCWKFQS